MNDTSRNQSVAGVTHADAQDHIDATRRGLFGLAVGMAALATPAIACAATNPTVAELWAEKERLEGVLSDDAGPAWARVFALEDAVLKGPITCRADALAKLSACALAFEVDGDVEDYRTAFHAALAWLKSN